MGFRSKIKPRMLRGFFVQGAQLVPTCADLCRLVPELLEVVVISRRYHRILNLRLGICLVFVAFG